MYRTTFSSLVINLYGRNYCSLLLYRLIPCTIFFCIILLTACTQDKRQHVYSIFTFGTLIDITLYDVDKQLADTVFEELQTRFDDYHQNWSPWTNGDLAKLNEQLSKPLSIDQSHAKIDVPEHLVPIIKKSISLSKQSDNFFNPAIGHLINLWQFHKYQDLDARPPKNRTILELVSKNPMMSDISFDQQNRLLSSNSAVLLNFGAFAKGYAIKLAIDYLDKMGIKNAVVNAGGDLSVIGHHGERPWNIGIRHPRNDTILASIKMNDDESVFTSGDYERFYFFQKKRYHHILDPTTGYPSEGAQSVTVLHHDAGIADAAATALFVAGRKHWQSIAKKMGIDSVMLVDIDGNIHLTPAMQKRLRFLDKSSTSHIITSEEL